MNERLRVLRKALGLNQGQLGNILGISNTAVSKLEKGENKITEQNIRALCRELYVSEVWLRTGAGEMFIHQDEDAEFMQICEEINLSDDLIKRIIKAYWDLDEVEKAAIRKLIDGLSRQ